jgi:presenilin-like A22 family membrane protease
MKHGLNVTLIIISIFILTQIVGLSLINADIKSVEQINDTIVIEHQQTSIGDRPETEGFGSFIYLVSAVIIGTILVLILMRFKKVRLWKLWFFFAVFLSVGVSLGVIMNNNLALLLGFILALLKIYKPNILVHNFTEVLMYSGIAVLLVPIFDVKWMLILLLVISVYDMYAVWKSKHMVKMAKFQTQSEVFAGIMIPYEKHGSKVEIKAPIKPASMVSSKKESKHELKNAILGGGDVAFPLLFAGVVMESLIRSGLGQGIALAQSLIISFFVTISILGLFIFAKKDKFYPAMPFVTIGCLIGYGIILIL